MFSIAAWILHWARTHMSRLFQQFGIHCATHQIRIIVISSLVITSLFYPALHLYSSSNPKSLSLIESFLSPNSMHAYQDLVDPWTGHQDLRTQNDRVSRFRCGVGRVLRVERVFLQGMFDDENGAINSEVLASTLALEERIEKLLASRHIPCHKGIDGRCLVLTPLAFWNHDKKALLSDPDVVRTLTHTKNVSISGIHVTPHMVLADRQSDEPHGSKHFNSAMFLALTYFFPESVCSGSGDRLSWDQVLASATSGAELVLQPQETTLIALEYTPSQSKQTGISAISAFLYLAYASFFAYVTWSMQRMKSVHSRIGLTFTALVEIAVSTITSLSVCALVGFKVTMVPWEFLPIVIVFVGAENMFNLVDAVSTTSITLSVKQRIAEGLSRAGTSNTLKVVSYNSILGVIAVFATGAIRQFCAFAIVVLVAHWFLAHTFFMAVLSIDIQRLELEELLRQNSYLTPAIPNSTKVTPDDGKSTSKWDSLMLFTRGLLSGRATKNLSLLLLLATTATLYYATLPSDLGFDDIDASLPRSVPLASRASPNNGSKSTRTPAYQIWKTLNPAEVTFHLRIESPAIVTFKPLEPEDRDRQSHEKRPRSRFSSIRTFRGVLWLLKIMVLPIGVTTLALWGLMLYLLKNADLLEAQRNKSDAQGRNLAEEATSMEKTISFSTLPRAFDSDVELIATSLDGQIVVSIGLQNEIVVWNVGNQTHFSIDSSTVLLRTASSSSASSALTCVTVDDRGEYCAVGTGSGIVAVWVIMDDRARALPHLTLQHPSAGVVSVRFTKDTHPIPFHPPPYSRPGSPTDPPRLIALYETGIVCNWNIMAIPSLTPVTPSSEARIVKSSIVRSSPDERLLVAFCTENGSLELVDVDGDGSFLSSDYSVQAGNPTDLVTNVHACRTVIRGETRTVVAAATEAGVVSLWDGHTGELISILDEAYGRINRLHVAPVKQETCHYCGHSPLDSFSLTFSVEQQVWFYKAYLPDETQRCTCTPTRVKRVPSYDSLPRRSRNNSVVSAGSSPLIGRPRLATMLESSSPFPVSGHGGRVHSRRASEKEARSRIPDQSLLLPLEDFDTGHALGPLGPSRPSSPPSLWQRAQVVRMTDTTCERGGWDVIDGKVVGVRRLPRVDAQSLPTSRKLIPNSKPNGLSAVTLDRWELWTFDPSNILIQSSVLSSLVEAPEENGGPEAASEPPSNHCIPRLPFTRINSFTTSGSRSLAGFGNTLGVFNFLKT